MNQIKSWKITGVLGSDKYFAITTPLGKIWVKNVLVLCTASANMTASKLANHQCDQIGRFKKVFLTQVAHISGNYLG